MMKRLWLLAALLLAGPAAVQAGEIHPFAKGGYARILADHAGKPLIVSFWSLTCAPCIAEMPVWRALKERRPGLDLVMVSTDSLAQAERLEGMLGRHRLGRLPAYAFADSFVERLRFEVDKEWRGELPLTVFIAADGRRDTVTGRIDERRVEDWLARQGRADADERAGSHARS